MSLKKFDLAKNLGLKIAGRANAAGVHNRFGHGAVEVLDKRERRARDAALGLVPFACKLPGDLIKRLHERAAGHEGGVNGLLAELLEKAMGIEEKMATPAEKPSAEKAPAENAPAKKAPAKKANAKKAASTAGDAQP